MGKITSIIALFLLPSHILGATGGVLFFEDFQARSVDSGIWSQDGQTINGEFGISSDPKNPKNKVFRHDVDWSNQYKGRKFWRSEHVPINPSRQKRFSWPPGTTVWFGFNVLLSSRDGFVFDEDTEAVVWQFRARSGASPPFAILTGADSESARLGSGKTRGGTLKGEWAIQYHMCKDANPDCYGKLGGTGDAIRKVVYVPAKVDSWETFIGKFRCGPQGGGELLLWLNGKQVVNYKGKLCYGDPVNKNVFPKLGVYEHHWIFASYHRDPSHRLRWSVYHDNIAYGGSDATYQDIEDAITGSMKAVSEGKAVSGENSQSPGNTQSPENARPSVPQALNIELIR